MNSENEKLIALAKEALKYSYSPYSDFAVGAALITDSGKMYTGCNIENSSYGATNCAERTAVFKAVSEGEKKIKKIAIVSSSGQKTPPCGICRQVLSEFMSISEGRIILEDDGKPVEYKLADFLPMHFSLKK